MTALIAPTALAMLLFLRCQALEWIEDMEKLAMEMRCD